MADPIRPTSDVNANPGVNAQTPAAPAVASFIGDGAPVSFVQAIERGLLGRGAAGRASRSEFWYFFLLCVACEGLIAVFLRHLPSVANVLESMVAVTLLEVLIRRLHDVNRSGWWVSLPIIVALSSYFSELQRFGPYPTMLAAAPVLFWLIATGHPGRTRFDIGDRGPDKGIGAV